MKLEILPFDLETELQGAIDAGGTNNYELLVEFAARYPDGEMVRKNKDGTVQTFTGDDVTCAVEQFLDFRPEAKPDDGPVKWRWVLQPIGGDNYRVTCE